MIESNENRDLVEIVTDIAGSFRMNAPISVHDIRAISELEGKDLSNVNGGTISRCLLARCDPIEGMREWDSDNGRHYYRRRW